jgi:short-subunit dehydrogenase involved in D-alanine esterification of teichoic acids
MKTSSSLNRVALVTGGSRGIGAAIVRRLIQEEVAVAFTYSSAREKALTLAAEIEGCGGRALAIQADSANATEVRDAVSKTVEAFGRLNILQIERRAIGANDVLLEPSSKGPAAETYLYLLHERFSTGAMIVVDGGSALV